MLIDVTHCFSASCLPHYHPIIPPVTSEGHSRSVDPPVLVPLLAFTRAELAHYMALLALASQHVLVRDEALQTHWPACVDASRTDADLRAKSIAEPVREPCARVHERPRRIHPSAERRRDRLVLSDDAVRVVRRVRIDVPDCGGNRRHGEHGEGQAEVFRRVGFWGGRLHMCGKVGRGRGQALKYGE